MLLSKLVYKFEQTIQSINVEIRPRLKVSGPYQVFNVLLETQGRCLAVLRHVVIHAYDSGHQFTGVIRQGFEALLVVLCTLEFAVSE